VTALLESLEGRRGEPRRRPPFPAIAGLHGRPTVLNNVETFANVPGILQHGAAWFRALGRRGAAGTKLYTVLGHVSDPGLVEAPLGSTLRELIVDLGGGMRPGSSFRCALVGGAAGVLVPASALDAPLDYRGGAADALEIGSGGVLVCDEGVPIAALLAELLHFFEAESCGKCTPCRVGTRRARVVLDRIAEGAGTPADTDELARLAAVLAAASFCGLGVSAAAPIQSALAHFRSELP
jgi:NADH:ubiquinone oxidoreductase subunit F (NADH-binding)